MIISSLVLLDAFAFFVKYRLFTLITKNSEHRMSNKVEMVLAMKPVRILNADFPFLEDMVTPPKIYYL
jgi:hypothetical protein